MEIEKNRFQHCKTLHHRATTAVKSHGKLGLGFEGKYCKPNLDQPLSMTVWESGFSEQEENNFREQQMVAVAVKSTCMIFLLRYLVVSFMIDTNLHRHMS